MDPVRAFARVAEQSLDWYTVIVDHPALTMRVGREIRAHREARGMSLSAAAKRAGVSKTILATIESGAGNPSLETLGRIAQALDVPVATLLAEDDVLVSRLIPRRDDAWITFESGIEGRILNVDGRDRRYEVLELRLAPGQRYAGPAHVTGTEELVIAIEGRLTVGPEGHERDIEPGDAVLFAADVPHVYHSADGGRAVCCFSYPAVRGR
jgi:transcriptional regulator with XRE-family HTH domain